MIGRKAQLRRKIDDVIERLQIIQHTIAGSRQPASQFEIAELKELGERYADLNQELQAFLKRKKG
jgi:hypothetical protein